MNKVRSMLTLSIFVVSLFLTPDTNRAAYAQQTPINEAVAAVVRILGCNVAGCNQGLGSGVLIHPSGVVLTANHVTLSELNDPTSQLEDFLIEMTTSAQLPPQPRYRARLVAFKPESDLALLRIYWDEIANQAIDVTTLPDLPTLPLVDAETVMLGEQVHILGYPLAGGRAINYAQLVVGGFDEGGTLIKVSTTLSEGNSGGPALVERNGRFEIAGIVLRRRGTLGEIGFIRRIDQLQEMTWLANAQRVWVDNVQVSTEGTGATASLQISAQIHALDMVNRHVYLLAYAFEANSYRPWRPSPTGLPKSATGQVVFSQEFVAQHVVETAQTITFAQRSLGVDPQQLLFRLLLWDSEATQVLWQDTEWRLPQPADAVALAPPTPTETQTSISTPTLLLPTPTETPVLSTETATITPAPDLIASATAIAQMLAMSIAATQTALPTNTSTPTPNLAATTTAEAYLRETAIAATLAAQPAVVPTPTQTPSFAQVIATAVAATLTALPADTPTRMPTTTPTTALTPTRTPLPTKAPTATWTPTRTPTRTPTPLPCKPGVLYCEDFEDGRAIGWRLMDGRGQPSSGWKVIRDNTNYVFNGEGHQWATLDNHSWGDYRFRFRLKLIRGAIHLNYRIADSRYFIGFSENGLDLNRQIRDSFTDLTSASVTYRLNRWYQIEIAGWDGHIQVYVDDKLELDYTDSTPLLKGSIAFESLDNSAAQIDDIEVIDSKMITPDVVDQMRSALWSNTKTCQSGAMSGVNNSPVDINSPWLTNLVVFDGRISTAEEWSDATCLDLDLVERHTGPSTLMSRWWIKNDEYWLYLLARVPSNRPTGDGAYIEYFWPHPYTGLWKHSDRAYIGLEGKPFDEYGWDEQSWSDETQASPPGNNDVTGSASKDTTYRWFEFRKALNSGDGYDWVLKAGQTYGDEGDLLVGVYDVTGQIPFETYIRLKLGTAIASGSLQSASSTSMPSSSSKLIIDAANLNVRDGPGSSYKVLGVAKSGERYIITGRNSNSTWWQIDFNGLSGWVSSGYVRLLNPDFDVPVTSTITQPLNATPIQSSALRQTGSNCSVFWFGNIHSYLAVQEAVTWDIAKSRAEKIGGYLATIGSQQENEFVYALVKDNNAFWFLDEEYGNGIGPWLGGFQPDGAEEPDGGWQWVKLGENFGYQNWASSEPNNYGGDESSICFFGSQELKSSKWNDETSSSLLNGYIVEFDSSSTICIDAIR